ISASAKPSANSRSQETDTGPTTSGDSGNGVAMDLATPPQTIISLFCITIHAPIITSMVVSMSAPRIGRRRRYSTAAPSSRPAAIAIGEREEVLGGRAERQAGGDRDGNGEKKMAAAGRDEPVDGVGAERVE